MKHVGLGFPFPSFSFLSFPRFDFTIAVQVQWLAELIVIGTACSYRARVYCDGHNKTDGYNRDIVLSGLHCTFTDTMVTTPETVAFSCDWQTNRLLRDGQRRHPICTHGQLMMGVTNSAAFNLSSSANIG